MFPKFKFLRAEDVTCYYQNKPVYFIMPISLCVAWALTCKPCSMQAISCSSSNIYQLSTTCENGTNFQNPYHVYRLA